MVVLIRVLIGQLWRIALAVLVYLLANQILGTLSALLVLLVAQYILTVSAAQCLEAWLGSQALRRAWAHLGVGSVIALAGPTAVTTLLLIGIVALTTSPGVPVLLLLSVIPAGVVWRRQSARRSDPR